MYQKNFRYHFLKQDVSKFLFLIQYSYDIITLRVDIYNFNGEKDSNMICLQGLTHDMACIVTNSTVNGAGPEISKRVIHGLVNKAVTEICGI